jgi:predicted ATPase
MATLQEIEKQAQGYANAREILAATLAALDDETRALRRKYLASIRNQVAKAKEKKAELYASIDGSAALFVKPRTHVFHGVKCGFGKGKGKVEFDDEDAVIARIRKLLPEDQAELLISTKESVSKTAVCDLSGEDLKRLGIRVEGTGDVIVIKDAAGDVDKLVEALLKDDAEASE